VNARLVEIMESIQGEGLLVGSRQVFLRFAGCNLRCVYCDTRDSFEPQPFCLVRPVTGRTDLSNQVDNPLSVEQVLALIKPFSSQWISLTGGEPLLWAGFISVMGRSLKKLGHKLLLETNGTLYEQLSECLPYMDLISMDYKLASATGTDCSFLHTQFLIEAGHHPIYVKIVIDENSHEEEIKQAVQIIAGVNREITLVLQPVSSLGKSIAPGFDRLLALQKICSRDIPDVRIIPQMHKHIGLI